MVYLYIVHLLSISLLLIGNLSLRVRILFFVLKYSNYTLHQLWLWLCVYKMSMATYLNSLLLKFGHPRAVTYWIIALISFQFLEYLCLHFSQEVINRNVTQTDWEVVTYWITALISFQFPEYLCLHFSQEVINRNVTQTDCEVVALPRSDKLLKVCRLF